MDIKITKIDTVEDKEIYAIDHSEEVADATLLHTFSVYLCIVKGICFILALFIAFMTVYPCSDGHTCQDEQRIEISTHDQANHGHSSTKQNLCTPFCICACCASHVQVSNLTNPNFSGRSHNTKLVTLYQERPVLNSSHSIWQPPKI
ncbi:MAG: hypothetical protein JNL40_07180 [Cyclobacteriaceae bacterium]|nr:hypothetical protein [Cyclobacteriaceae bacterium]